MDNQKEIDGILDYWFGPLEEGFTKENRGKIWYMGGKEVDEEIRERFGALVEQARNKELDEWRNTALGRCTLVILLDQFTRNIFRKSKEAFSADAYARELCKEGIENGHDKELAPIHRCFLYHPLEHSESLEDQELSVKVFEAVLDAVDESQKNRVEGFVTYAKQHRDIVKQFGRFPHRNEVMGRESTAEEVEYLKDGARFGQ